MPLLFRRMKCLSDMKKNTARKVNTIIWTIIAIALMVTAYCEWSKHGEYTVVSFFASLVFHGGFSLVVAMQTDELICKKFNEK